MQSSDPGAPGALDPTTDLPRLLGESATRVIAVMGQIPDSAWDDPTPCSEWSVRDLVHHLVYEWVWVRPMLAGRTIADVGDRFEGDLLGSDPASAARSAAADAVLAESEPGASDGTVHASFGDIPAQAYLWQQLAEHVIHGWDLATALGVEYQPPEDALQAVAQWWTGVAGLYRQAGVTAPPVPLTGSSLRTASPLERFIAETGRDPHWQASEASPEEDAEQDAEHFPGQQR